MSDWRSAIKGGSIDFLLANVLFLACAAGEYGAVPLATAIFDAESDAHGMVVLMRENDEREQTFEDLAGLSVCVAAGP
eukprot:2299951-Rhodomonas_salina.1